MSEVTDRSAQALAPIDQAAILLLAMGEDEAAKALNHIDPRQVQRVGAAMAALGGVDSRQMDSVVTQFLETVSDESDGGMGASDYFKQMLAGTPARPRATTLVQRLFGGTRPGAGKLRWMDCRYTADGLRHQRPRLQAIMLAYLEPERAAEVLRELPDASARSAALMHLARLESTVARCRDLPGPNPVALGGRRAAAAILACLDDITSAAVVSGIRRLDPGLAEDIEAEQTRRPRRAAGPARAGRHGEAAVSEPERFARFHNRINDALDAQQAWLKRLRPAIRPAIRQANRPVAAGDEPRAAHGAANVPGPLSMLAGPSADNAA